MYVHRVSVPVTTDGSGNATVRTPPLNGLIRAIVYVPDGTNPLTNSASVTATGDLSGIPVVTIAAIGAVLVALAPRMATVNASDGAALYASGGATVNDLIPVADETLKFVISGGGAAKLGTFHVYVDGKVQGS